MSQKLKSVKKIPQNEFDILFRVVMFLASYFDYFHKILATDKVSPVNLNVSNF